MAPSGPAAPRTLRHEATGRRNVVHMTTPLNIRPAQQAVRARKMPIAFSCDKLIVVGTRYREDGSVERTSVCVARTQLLLGVGESRFEHFANRLPRAAVELN